MGPDTLTQIQLGQVIPWHGFTGVLGRMCRIWRNGQEPGRRAWWKEQVTYKQQRQLPGGMLAIAKAHMDGASSSTKDTAGMCKTS